MSSFRYKKGKLYVGENNGFYLAMSTQLRCVPCKCCVEGKKMKKSQGNKEILRRALSPPPSKGFRWLNFRPTPSRLSNMSTA
ncbi:unnamed protein product [Lupinus luteus]|uniref:Uncharacterized protein n=1 Tax=Lupinus luteus TaxID=3873 RepID=A0AAV1YIL2_LUPLU